MAKLTSNARNKLGKAVFGLPGKRAFPMPDASHASNAKARATQGVNAGTLSPGSAAKIKAKANKILGARKSADPKPPTRPAVHGEHSSALGLGGGLGAGHMMDSPGVTSPSGGSMGGSMGGAGGMGGMGL